MFMEIERLGDRWLEQRSRNVSIIVAVTLVIGDPYPSSLKTYCRLEVVVGGGRFHVKIRLNLLVYNVHNIHVRTSIHLFRGYFFFFYSTPLLDWIIHFYFKYSEYTCPLQMTLHFICCPLEPDARAWRWQKGTWTLQKKRFIVINIALEAISSVAIFASA